MPLPQARAAAHPPAGLTNGPLRDLIATFVQLTDALSFSDNERRLLLDVSPNDLWRLRMSPELVDSPRLRHRMVRAIGVLRTIVAAA